MRSPSVVVRRRGASRLKPKLPGRLPSDGLAILAPDEVFTHASSRTSKVSGVPLLPEARERCALLRRCERGAQLVSKTPGGGVPWVWRKRSASIAEQRVSP